MTGRIQMPEHTLHPDTRTNRSHMIRFILGDGKPDMVTGNRCQLANQHVPYLF
jgi:hypothetical protein